MRSDGVCALCGSHDAHPLPDPAAQSMTSDWCLIQAPLGKQSCGQCGLVYRDSGMRPPADFAAGYDLYAHAPGFGAEQRRQSQYAAWIAGSVRTPVRALDVGCGNGSLLLALREHWPHAALAGCDPSAAGIQHAIAAGLTVWTGTADDLAPRGEADLVISVNVVEHTRDPRAFVAILRAALAHDGQLVLVCPDGARPGVELLVADHLFSFTAAHLETLLCSAGLTIEHWSQAPRQLGAFQMAVASADAARRFTVSHQDPLALRNAKHAYLTAWRALDSLLAPRLPPTVVCFGAGEAAGLLRAYAPRAWSHVRLCTTDEPLRGMFGDLQRVPLNEVPADSTVLVAARPQDQPRVADRLRTRFRQVVTWYDLVPPDDG